MLSHDSSMGNESISLSLLSVVQVQFSPMAEYCKGFASINHMCHAALNAGLGGLTPWTTPKTTEWRPFRKAPSIS